MRYAEISDLDAIFAIDPVRDEKRRLFLQESVVERKVLLAMQEDQVSGYIVFDENFFGKPFIHLLAVAENLRRRGIARELIQAVEERVAIPKIFTSTNRSNIAAQALFKKLGYVESGIVYNLDTIDPEIFFFKSLMAHFTVSTVKANPQFQTERLNIRMAEEKDIPAILRYYKTNEIRFAPTDPPKPAGFFTENFWMERIRKMHLAWDLDQALSLFLFERTSNDLVGTISFSQMFRGPFQACYLGYTVDGAQEGKGLMREALPVAIAFVFQELNYHRIMATYLPENERSARVLQHLDFVVEGVAKDYLFINGRWRDHVLTALTNPRWKSATT